MAFTLTAQIKLQNPDNIGQFINQLRGQIGKVNVNVNVSGGGQLNALNKQLTTVASSAGKASNSISNFGEQAALAAKRFFAFSIATNGFLKLIGAIQRGAVDAIAFEKEVYKIAQVTGTAVRDMKDLTAEVTRLSTSLGVSSNKILTVAQVLAQAGLSAEDTKTALAALAQTELAATFDNLTDTGEAAVAMMAQFGLKANQLGSKLGSINAVAGKFAVESADLTVAIRRTGGAFQAAGGSLEELISLFTSVRATTRESAESIATGFRTIFTRLQRTKTVTFLEDIGVQLRDFEGQFVGPYEAIRRLSAVLKEIPSTDPRFAQVIEELGGFRQVSKVIPLIQKFGEAEKALVVAQQGQGSLARDAAQAQGSLANQLAKVREEFDALLRKIAGNDAFKGMVQVTTQLAIALIKVADAATPLLPFLSIIAALKVNNVAPAFFSSFVKKGGLGFNEGGEVPAMKFARGGLVPGTGNTDTVRANLTPGEFVLRKDAVNAIGVNNLHGLQNRKKFAIGGAVENFTDPERKEFLDALRNAGGGTGAKISNPDIKKSVNAVISKYIGPDNNPYSTQSKAAFRLSGSFDALAASNANKETKEKIKAKKSKIADNITTLMPPEEERTFGAIYLKPVGSSETTGRRDVDMVSNIEGYGNIPVPIFYKHAAMSADSANNFTKRFDSVMPKVVSGLGRDLASSFGSKVQPTRLDKVPGYDAVKGWLFEGALTALGAPYAETQDGDDNRTFDFPRGMGKLKSIFGTSLGANRPVDAKLTAGTQEGSLNKKAKTWLYENYKNFFKKPDKFAIGGQAKGTDTVPAVLTPGEFVFTKEAAQGIGYDNLNKLNKAKGYAKGGVVQKFATGGAVGGGGGGIFSGGGGIIALAIGVQTLAQQFGTLSKEMQTVIGAVTSTGTNFIIFKGLLDQINPKWKDVGEGLDNVNAKKEKDVLAAKDARSQARDRRNANIELKDRIKSGITKNKEAVQTLKQDYNLAKSSSILSGMPIPQKDQADFASRLKFIKAQQQGIKLAQFDYTSEKNIGLIDIKAARTKRNESRTAYKTAIQKQERLEKISTIGSTVGLATASAASSVGGLISERGTANIRAGGTSTFASGAGGGLQGAATGAILGATIGSAIAPGIGTAIGAAIGGVGGAIAGTVTALQQANQEIASVKFEATFKEFQRKIVEGATLSDLNTFGRKASDRLQSTSGDDRVTSIGQIENASSAIDSIFKQTMFNIAKNGNNASQVLAEFTNNTNPELLNVFALSTGRSLLQLEHDLKKSADSAVKMANSHIKAVTAIERVADRMNFLANITSGLATTQQLLDESQSRAGLASSGQFGLQPSRATAYLNSPQSFNPNNNIIKGEIASALSNLGPASNSLSANFTAGTGVIDKVRTVLGGVRSKGTIENASEVAIDSFGQIPDIFRQGIINSLKEFESTSDQPAKLANELETNFESTVEKVTENLKKLAGFDVIKQSIELNIKAFNNHLDIINKINDIQKQNIDLSLQGIAAQESYFDNLKDLKVDNPNKTDVNRDKQRQAILFNNPDLFNNPSLAGKSARDTLTGLEREQNKANPDVNTVQILNDRLASATDGLKYLTDYATRAAGPLKKIAEIRAKKQEAVGFVDSTFGGGASSIRDSFKQLTLLNQATTGGIDNISSKDQVGLLQFVEQNREASVAALGGEKQFDKFTTDIRKNLLNNSPLNSLGRQDKASGRFLSATNTNLNATIVEQLTELKAIHKSSEEATKELQALNQQKVVSLNGERKNIDLAQATGQVNINQNILKQEEAKLASANSKKSTAAIKLNAISEIERLAGIDQTLPDDLKAQRLAEVRGKDFTNERLSTDILKEQDIFKAARKNRGILGKTGNNLLNLGDAAIGFTGYANENYTKEQVDARKMGALVEHYGKDAAKILYKQVNSASLGGKNNDGTYNDTRLRDSIITEAEKAINASLSQTIDPKFDNAIANRDKIRTEKLKLAPTDTRQSLKEEMGAAEQQIVEYSATVQEAAKQLNIATNNLAALTQTMKDYPIPSQIQFNGLHNIQVEINGAQVLSQITPGVEGIVRASIQAAFDRFVNVNGGRLRNIGP